MAKVKAPYSFPLRSRKAIVDFLSAFAESRRYYHGSTYLFVWNVKAYRADFDGESLRRVTGSEYELAPRFDAKWQAVVNKSDRLFWEWCEDAAREVNDGDWSSYPGDDQGDWQFSFAGRCGGWIVLEKWRGNNLTCNQDELNEWLLELPFADLVKFYRGIVTANQDFTPDNAAWNVMYAAAYYRAQLESEWIADETSAARIWESERPDMYCGKAA